MKTNISVSLRQIERFVRHTLMTVAFSGLAMSAGQVMADETSPHLIWRASG